MEMFTREFKLEAVKLIMERYEGGTSLAGSGVHPTRLQQ